MIKISLDKIVNQIEQNIIVNIICSYFFVYLGKMGTLLIKCREGHMFV